jgi:hypothetical protein
MHRFVDQLRFCFIIFSSVNDLINKAYYELYFWIVSIDYYLEYRYKKINPLLENNGFSLRLNIENWILRQQRLFFKSVIPLSWTVLVEKWNGPSSSERKTVKSISHTEVHFSGVLTLR